VSVAAIRIIATILITFTVVSGAARASRSETATERYGRSLGADALLAAREPEARGFAGALMALT